MNHAFCVECGSGVYQWNAGAVPGIAFFPTTFKFEDGESAAHLTREDFVGKRKGKSYMLPEQLKPKIHCNYENRQWDWADAIPKFKDFPTGIGSGIELYADGEVKSKEGEKPLLTKEGAVAYLDEKKFSKTLQAAVSKVIQEQPENPTYRVGQILLCGE